MNGQSYPEVAAHALASVARQNPSPFYGYLRSGYQQKIYLFDTVDAARGWFTAIVTAQQPHDYAAVFSAVDLRRPTPLPMQGLENFGHTNVSGDPYVGNWLPFLLGLPFGGVGGYFLRRWQEDHPGQMVPGIPAHPSSPPPADPAGPPVSQAPVPPGHPAKIVGGPWIDMQDPAVGGPWLDMTGPMVGGPWLDMQGPVVGGPWLDMINPPISTSDGYTVGGPWLDMINPPISTSDGYTVGGPWLDMTGPMVGAQPWLDMTGPMVGAQPWLDMTGPMFGAQPWLDIVGFQYGTPDAERRYSWPLTRALIQSAIDEVRAYAASYPADAYVWKLDSSGTIPYTGSGYGSVVTIEPQTMIAQFPSRDQALDYMRSVSMTRPIALALFDRTSQHWPNPVAWRKSDDPGQEAQIAQFVANRGGARVSGSTLGGGAYVGASGTVIGAALDDVRRRAKTLAKKRASNVIGVIHTPADNLWHTLAFRTADDADDWLNTATRDPAAYTYAAYFDKDGDAWPNPYIEKIGGTMTVPVRRERGTQHDWVGATVDPRVRSVLDELREHARQLAALNTSRTSGAAGVIRTSDGLWHALGLRNLDDAVDWLQAATQKDKTAFVYAAIFEKGSDGSAYFQQEEIGEQSARPQLQEIIRRGIATTSGHDPSVGGPWVDIIREPWAA